jgi:N-acetylmuramoyl-L-alanine amidase
MSDYTVQQGDCLSSIAADFGFIDYRVIYNHPKNAAFKAKRPNPNLIYPGDVLWIPDKEPKQSPAATATTTVFKVKAGPGTRLRVVLLDMERKPLAGRAYTLTVAGNDIKGTTGGDGMVDQPIPDDAASATLLLDDKGVTRDLELGKLDPIDTVSGYQARLKNLGYDPGPIDGVAGPLTAGGVSAFQTDNAPLAVDGDCGPKTQAVLKDKYGC